MTLKLPSVPVKVGNQVFHQSINPNATAPFDIGIPPDPSNDPIGRLHDKLDLEARAKEAKARLSQRKKSPPTSSSASRQTVAKPSPPPAPKPKSQATTRPSQASSSAKPKPPTLAARKPKPRPKPKPGPRYAAPPAPVPVPPNPPRPTDRPRAAATRPASVPDHAAPAGPPATEAEQALTDTDQSAIIALTARVRRHGLTPWRTSLPFSGFPRWPRLTDSARRAMQARFIELCTPPVIEELSTSLARRSGPLSNTVLVRGTATALAWLCWHALEFDLTFTPRAGGATP